MSFSNYPTALLDGQLLTVHDYLQRCDAQRLCFTLLREHAGWKLDPHQLGSTQKQALIRVVRKSLSCMASSQSSAPIVPDHIFLPLQTFQLLPAEQSFKLSQTAVRLPINSLPDLPDSAQDPLYSTGSHSCTLIRNHPSGSGNEELAQCSPHDQNLQQLSTLPWAQTLSQLMWLPDAFCSKERHQVCASIFWAMTRFGFFDQKLPDDLSFREHSAEVLTPVHHSPSKYVRRLLETLDQLNAASWLNTLHIAHQLRPSLQC